MLMMARCTAWVLVSILLCHSSPAFANGGPVDESPGTIAPDDAGRGDVVPVEERGIRLVSEHLRIFGGDEGWKAQARYVLSNSGQARQVDFGVPTIWTTPMGVEYARIHGEGAARIRIVSAGKPQACTPVLGRETTFDGPDGTRLVTNGWCVATVEIAHGSTTLDLDYPIDYASAGYHGYSFGAERGTYILAPAGYWRGPASHVRIEIDPVHSSLRGRVKVIWPPGFVADGRRLIWEGHSVDLRELKAVVFDYNPELMRRWQEGGWMRTSVRYSMSASSTLPPQGKYSYEPAKAADANDSTAWCEGAPGEGEGQWLAAAFEFAVPKDQECKVRDVLLVPGYARNDATFESNARLQSFRIEDCQDPENGFEVSLADEKQRVAWLSTLDPAKRTWEIALPEGMLEHAPRCLRLRALTVLPGKSPDLCVSEFLPRVYCKAKTGT